VHRRHRLRRLRDRPYGKIIEEGGGEDGFVLVGRRRRMMIGRSWSLCLERREDLDGVIEWTVCRLLVRLVVLSVVVAVREIVDLRWLWQVEGLLDQGFGFE
jgi:hypothetical protein